MALNFKINFSKSFPVLREVVLAWLLFRKKKYIADDNNRYLRASILRYYSYRLKEKIKEVEYEQGILVYHDQVFVLSDGILLNTKNNNRYFKIPKGKPGNQGKELFDFLASKKIALNTMVDLGANYGEISLFFCKNNPQLKILAVEASPCNFQILKESCKIQFFPTDNIVLVNEAVCDHSGEVEITNNLGSENTMIIDEDILSADKVKIKADSLESLLRRYQFNTVDFMKIDIEGAEYLLYDSLKLIINNVKSITIEVGENVSHDKYVPLIELFVDSGMNCYSQEGKRLADKKNIFSLISNEPCLDLWFVREINN